MKNISYSDSLTIVKLDPEKVPVIDGNKSKDSLFNKLSRVGGTAEDTSK